MRPLNNREKRTLRIGGLVVAVYLAGFVLLQAWKIGQGRRAEYQRMVREYALLSEKVAIHQEKAKVAGELMEEMRMDPMSLSRTTLVAAATAAIHQSAMKGGIQLGPVRETPSSAGARELSAVQLEAVGPVPAILSFLQGIGTLGFPLIADSVQFTAEQRPGQVKMNVTIVLLDFAQWKTSEDRSDARTL